MGYRSFFLISAVVVICLAQELTKVKDTYDSLKNCYDADKTQLNTCMFDFWVNIRPHLMTGIPEFGVPPIDPVPLGRIQFPEDSAIIQGDAYFDNLTLSGLGNYTMRKVEWNSLKQDVNLFYPLLVVNGFFLFDGTALLLPLKGNGTMEMMLKDVDSKFTMTVERHGTGIRLADTLVDFTAKNRSIAFDNLIGGDDVGRAVSRLINMNSQSFIKEVKPQININLAKALKTVLTGVMKELPQEPFM